MAETRSERPVSLSESSWRLLDEAAKLDGTLTPSDFLDSLVQGLLASDDGKTIERAEAIAGLRKLFGDNHG